MSDFCCRTFFVPAVPDPAGLYGAICAAVPPCYLCGQGFSNDRLRFGLEGGLQAELRFCGDRCEVWLRHCLRTRPRQPPGCMGRYWKNWLPGWTGKRGNDHAAPTH